MTNARQLTTELLGICCHILEYIEANYEKIFFLATFLKMFYLSPIIKNFANYNYIVVIQIDPYFIQKSRIWFVLASH